MAGLLLLLLLAPACTGPEPRPPVSTITALDPPAGPEAMAPVPALSAGSSGATENVLLTWLEPMPSEGGEADTKGYRLLFSRLQGDRWSPPVEIKAGNDFFANWADLPGVVEAAPGTLVAHWLAKLGQDTYAYGVRLALSTDGGNHWSEAGWLHDDTSPTEHGFVSYAFDPQRADSLRAFWLDGRAMMPAGNDGEGPGPMQLRTATLLGGKGDTPPPSTLMDDRVCECCATDAAWTATGPIVAYRDRSEEEVRDIAVVRWTADGPSRPTPVHRDGWRIPGCPVNGPAIAADPDGSRVAVAWFTAADDRPRVLMAFSEDGGGSFGSPVLLDGDRPLGRVDLVLVEEGAWVSWLAASGDVRLRQVPSGVAADSAEPLITVGHAGTTRSAGVPRLVRSGDRLMVAWVREGRLRAASHPIRRRTPPIREVPAR